MRFRLNVPTARGTVLNGVLFRKQQGRKADTVMIAITGGIVGFVYIAFFMALFAIAGTN